MTRVAVIDPQPAVRAGLAMLLRREPGLVPVGAAAGAHDGRTSCSLAQRPDVVLLEHHLLDGDGIALCRRLKADGDGAAGDPLHGVPDAEVELLARVAGADGIVDKAAAPRGAVRGDPRWSPAARRALPPLDAASSSTPRRTASSPTTSRCSRCSSTARSPARRRRDAAHRPRRVASAPSACSAGCAGAPRRAPPPDAPARPAILSRHAPGPHGHRAHRPWRARVRHLLAPAQRAHHLPRLADRRPDREPGRRAAAAPRVAGPRQGHLDLHQLARRLDLRRARDLRHDAVHQARRGDDLRRHRDVDGLAAAHRRRAGQAHGAAELAAS